MCACVDGYGIDDNTTEIVGITEDVFTVMDATSNTISDMCVPQIVPNISVQTIKNTFPEIF